MKLAPSCTTRRDGTGKQRPELRIEFLAAVDEAMERMVRLAKHMDSPPGIDPTSASSASS